MSHVAPPLAIEVLDRVLASGEAGDERSVVSAATRVVGTLFGERGSCILVDGQPRVVAATHAPTLTSWPVDLARYPEIALALDSRQVVAVDDVREDARLAGVRSMLPPSLVSVMVIPMVLGRRRLGALIAQSTQPRATSAEDLALAALIGRLTAQLLDRVRMLPATAPEPPAATASTGREPTQPVAFVGAKPTAVAAAPYRRRVLVVDDDESQRTSIQLLLEENGYEVATADDGVAGVDRARQSPPDLILLDVSMPLLDGFAAAERLREDPVTARIPLLFLSACDDLMLRVRGLRLGAADFVAKPCFAPELLARIERAIDNANFRRRVHAQTHVDELTGLGNLRALRDRLAVEQARRERHGSAIAIAVLDLDRLKQINDRLGHAVGSRVIAAVGEALRSTTRASDLAVRYGGDEFVVVLPHANTVDALSFAERLLSLVGALRIDGVTPSLSIGVAALGTGDPGDVETLLQRADAAAYEAKRAGGNRVASAQPDDPALPQQPAN